MASNQYYSFAVGVGANTLTNSAYAALSTLLSNGFQPGVASSEQMNTVWRQATTAAAGVAQFAADNQSADVLDDGSAANFAARLDAAVKAVIAANAVPAGCVSAYFGSVPPTGWLECNGVLVLKTDFPALYAKRTFWGGTENTSFFSLPDLRGEFLRGWDHGRGADPGRSLGTFQAFEMQAHTHTYNQASGGVGGVAEGGSRDAGGPSVSVSGSAGGGETRPRNVSVMYIIKT